VFIFEMCYHSKKYQGGTILPIKINDLLPELLTTTIQGVIEDEMPLQRLSYTTSDTKGKRVASYNNKGTTTWDKININIIQKIKSLDGVNSTIYKRGNWDMLLIHDTRNKIILTLMREQRLKTVLNELKRGSLHYIGSMVREFNDHIEPQQLYLDGIEIANENQEYSDKLCIQQIVDALQEQNASGISEVVTVVFRNC